MFKKGFPMQPVLLKIVHKRNLIIITINISLFMSSNKLGDFSHLRFFFIFRKIVAFLYISKYITEVFFLLHFPFGFSSFCEIHIFFNLLGGYFTEFSLNRICLKLFLNDYIQLWNLPNSLLYLKKLGQNSYSICKSDCLRKIAVKNINKIKIFRVVIIRICKFLISRLILIQILQFYIFLKNWSWRINVASFSTKLFQQFLFELLVYINVLRNWEKMIFYKERFLS